MILRAQYPHRPDPCLHAEKPDGVRAVLRYDPSARA